MGNVQGEAGIATPLLLHCPPAQAVASASAAAAATFALPDAVALQKRYTAPCLRKGDLHLAGQFRRVLCSYTKLYPPKDAADRQLCEAAASEPLTDVVDNSDGRGSAQAGTPPGSDYGTMSSVGTCRRVQL